MRVLAALAVALVAGVGCTSSDNLPVGGNSGSSGSGGGSGSALPSGVYAIPLITPSDDNQGAFYTPTLTTEGASFLLDLDTGSTVTGIAGSGCASCSGMSPLYSPGASATSTGLQGSAKYADNSGWSGEIYGDTVGLGDGTPNVTLDFVDISTQDMFFSGNDYQGILGMGPDALLSPGTTAYLDQVATAGVTKKLGIELCATDGTMWIGGVDPSHAASALQYTPILQTGANDIFYSVDMTAMALGSAGLGSASDFQDPIVDTGTSLFYIPSTSETSLISAINSSSAFHTLFPGQTVTDPTNSSSASAGCVQAASTTTDAMVDDMLPKLTMTFDKAGGGSVAISATALDSYFMDAGNGQFCLMIEGGGDNGNMIMGDVFLRGFVTEIDLVNNQVGFAPTAYCPAAFDAGAVQHRILERGRGPRGSRSLRIHSSRNVLEQAAQPAAQPV